MMKTEGKQMKSKMTRMTKSTRKTETTVTYEPAMLSVLWQRRDFELVIVILYIVGIVLLAALSIGLAIVILVYPGLRIVIELDNSRLGIDDKYTALMILGGSIAMLMQCVVLFVVFLKVCYLIETKYFDVPSAQVTAQVTAQSSRTTTVEDV